MPSFLFALLILRDADAGVKASTDGGTSGTCVQRRSTEGLLAIISEDGLLLAFLLLFFLTYTHV